jgi:hypothetical protein
VKIIIERYSINVIVLSSILVYILSPFIALRNWVPAALGIQLVLNTYCRRRRY